MREGIIYFLAFGSQRVLVCRDRELLCLDFWISVLRTLPWLIVTPQGKAVDADQLTDDEWRISSRKALKGFTRLDARYFIPFFTRKFTRQVRKNNVISFEPRPYSCVPCTAMSVLWSSPGLSINGCSYSKTSLTKENKIDQSRSFGLRRRQWLGAIQAEPPSLLLDQGNCPPTAPLTYVSHWRVT